MKPLTEVIKDMPLSELEAIIRQRPEVASISIVTSNEMEKLLKNQHEENRQREYYKDHPYAG